MAVSSTSAIAMKVYVPRVPFGSEGSGPGQFKEPMGVAVDESTSSLTDPAAGDVYVVTRVTIVSSGSALRGNIRGSLTVAANTEVEGKKETGAAAPTGKFSAPEQVAVNNDESSPAFGDVYVLDTGHEVIDEFSSTGEYKGQITVAETCNPTECAFEKPHGGARTEKLTSVAVDPAGNIWIADAVREEFGTSSQEIPFVSECSDTGSCTIKFPFYLGSVGGIAVNSSGNVYVLSEHTTVHKLESSGKTKGRIETGSALAFAFDPLTKDPFLDEGDGIASFGPIEGRDSRT